MNGVHDMGGMHGFGPLEIEPDEPVFHHDWEAKTFCFNFAVGAWGTWNIDGSRFSLESLPPADYLRLSYYERWLAGLCNRMLAGGLISETELRTGTPDPGAEKRQPALSPDRVPALMQIGRPSAREIDSPPRFAVGDGVRTAIDAPAGHTRLPRYARGCRGTVAMRHGGHVFPDSNFSGAGEAPQHLYAVRFPARALWGEQGGAKDSVVLDLWENYLEPAD